MLIHKTNYLDIRSKAEQNNAILVAVSKTKTLEAIKELYDLGQRDFGENYVQELVEKQKQLPSDIRWHFIGHLQTNKVKAIAPFVFLIHGVESRRLIQEINKQAQKNNRTIGILLQAFIAKEESKFGLDELEIHHIMAQDSEKIFTHVRILGLMGMASFTQDLKRIREEFSSLRTIWKKYTQFQILSMGMSGDYEIALEEGSTMIRIGSLIFGTRASSA
ncbi:MAG: YggS family pyridoxal phosphate-dependent enzyme [Flavisolibacter sp.]